MRHRAWLQALVLLIVVLVQRSAVAAPSSGCHAVADGKVPVILVHGFISSADDAYPTTSGMVTALTGIPGAQVERFDYKAANDHWVTDPLIGPALARYALCLSAASSATGGTGKIALVGHSMGGLAIRCALAPECSHAPGLAAKVGLVVTLGTPYQGSFLRGDAESSSAQQALGWVLSTDCKTADFVLPASLASTCGLVSALGTSDAAKAFTPGSAELTMLPGFPPSLPVLALAGVVHLTTTVFGREVALDGNGGDLVVGTDSALAAGSAMTRQLDCGTLDIALAALPGKHPTCWHMGETKADQFVSATLGAVGSMVRQLGISPCTAVAMRTDLVGHPEVSGITCHSGWAVADVCGGECVDAGKILHRVAGRWRIAGYVLQDCQETLIGQHVPRAIARQFSYPVCNPPSPTGPECSTTALAIAIFKQSHVVYDVSQHACDGDVAVGFATANTDADAGNPDFGYFAFTGSGAEWVSHGLARTPQGPADFNAQLTPPLSTSQIARAWHLQQSLG